ncbi:MAG TPA: acyl-CoA dehydrogenase family protein, partial [Actinomycetota bacterium]|nr:acyl-CoA dehydrogenase family protein [Actinomycetota bacterium]
MSLDALTMDFELSEDQLALRQAARGLLDDLSSPLRVRGVVDRGGGFDEELWKAMAVQGWMGVEVPEAQGGLGLGTVEAAVLLEEVGRHLAPAPFLSSLLAVGALARAAASGVAWADRWVESLVSGEAIGAVAWEPRAPVLFAPSADVIVACVTEDDGSPVLIGAEVADRRAGRQPAMDLTRELGWVELEGLPAVRLGGPEAVATMMDRGAVGHAAEMLGGAGRALELAVEHAKDRVQFGRPIGSFQAVKHRCADMLVDVEGMRSSVYHGAWCISAGDPDAAVAASTAKVWCSDAGPRVMASCLQVHGGIGFTWEHDLHLFLKRAQLDQVSFG